MLIENQTRTEKSIGDLIGVVARQIDLADARAVRMDEAHLRTEQSISDLAVMHARTEQTIAGYVAAADARMIRIEENLDGLIRAITREHSNGKSHS